MRLNSIRIVTKDVPELARFYQTVTQIAPISPMGNPNIYVEIRTEGGIIAIAAEESVAKYNAEAATGAANRSLILEFEVLDVVAERKRLGASVNQWVMEPTPMPWGNHSMLFRDPDGNLINIYTSARAAS